jgi:hypothetical protein
MRASIEIGFLLDRQWHVMRSEPEGSKKLTLLLLGRVLADAGIAYAIIGGVALQVHQDEPRTTLDIDLAVADRGEIPRRELTAAGFSEVGRFTHSENWAGPDGTPVQFTDDPALAGPVARAEQIEIEGVALRVIRRSDLLHEKLRSAADPARRRSKRLQDLADAQALLETDSAAASELTDQEKATLDRLF